MRTQNAGNPGKHRRIRPAGAGTHQELVGDGIDAAGLFTLCGIRKKSARQSRR
jgi:hypothetical protein